MMSVQLTSDVLDWVTRFTGLARSVIESVAADMPGQAGQSSSDHAATDQQSSGNVSGGAPGGTNRESSSPKVINFDKEEGSEISVSAATGPNAVKVFKATYGEVAYFVSKGPAILPLLTQSSQLYRELLGEAIEADQAMARLAAREQEIGGLDDVVDQIHKKASRQTRDEAGIAKHAGETVGALDGLLGSLQREMQRADSNLTVTRQDFDADEDEKQANELLKMSADAKALLDNGLACLTTAMKVVKGYAAGGPAGAMDSVVDASLKIFENVFPDPWIADAKALQDKAATIRSKSVKDKYAAALSALEDVKQALPPVRTQVTEAQNSLPVSETNAEDGYDTDADNADRRAPANLKQGKFRFDATKKAIDEASSASGMVEASVKKAVTLYGILDRLRRLADKEKWMANQEAHRLLESTSAHVLKATHTLQGMEKAVAAVGQRFSTIYKEAHEALFRAPGKG